MAMTVADFRETVPSFGEIEEGETMTVNGEKYDIVGKSTTSPAPGEELHELLIEGVDGEFILQWNPAHTIEELWITPTGADPMTDGTRVDTIEYHS